MLGEGGGGGGGSAGGGGGGTEGGRGGAWWHEQQVQKQREREREGGREGKVVFAANAAGLMHLHPVKGHIIPALALTTVKQLCLIDSRQTG